MNITVNTQAFAHELRLLNQVVPTKPSLPILMNVLLRAEDHLYMNGTDMELGFSTACRAHIEEGGNITLPAKRLLDIVEQFPDADMQIFTKGTHVHVVCGAFKSRLQAMPADAFVAMPTAGVPAAVLATPGLQAMIGHVRYAISDRGQKFTIGGGLLRLTGTHAALVATDGKRLALSAMTQGCGDPCDVVIPSKAMDALASMFSDPALEFSRTGNHLFFVAGGRTFFTTQLAGQFPNYDRIIPREHDKKAVVDRHALAAALRRVGVVSETSMAADFHFSAEGVAVSSSSAEVGDAAEHVACGYTGEPVRVRCSWRYVLDFLEAAAGQTVGIELKDDVSPIKLTDGGDHLAVIMTMRA